MLPVFDDNGRSVAELGRQHVNPLFAEFKLPTCVMIVSLLLASL